MKIIHKTVKPLNVRYNALTDYPRWQTWRPNDVDRPTGDDDDNSFRRCNRSNLCYLMTATVHFCGKCPSLPVLMSTTV